MDWGVQNGTATVMSMADGSASVYLSSGGGYLGGHGIEGVRLAAQRAIAQARAVQLPEQPATSFPVPKPHEVVFHLLTDAGAFSMPTNEHDLNSVSHPLRKLGDAMQSVITEFRTWQANAKAKSDQTTSKRKPN